MAPRPFLLLPLLLFTTTTTTTTITSAFLIRPSSTTPLHRQQQQQQQKYEGLLLTSASPSPPSLLQPPPLYAATAPLALTDDDTDLMSTHPLPNYTETDRKHMRRALQLAAQAQGHTRPNPVVGCVVLDANGEVVGEGFHPKAGEPHAEVFALREAGEKARGGTAYVTLEPCNHHGRTPPCVDALLRAGVSKVVAGMVDPFPLVGGKGLARLEAGGVKVVVGCEEAKCKEINRPFLHRVAHGTPLGFLPLSYREHKFVRPERETLRLGDGTKALQMIDAIVVDQQEEGLRALGELEAGGDLQASVVRVVVAPELGELQSLPTPEIEGGGVRRVVITTKKGATDAPSAVAALQAQGVEIVELDENHTPTHTDTQTDTDPLSISTYLHSLGCLSALWLLCPEGAKKAVKAGVVQDVYIHVTLSEADELDGVDDPDFMSRTFGRNVKVSVMSCDATVGAGACVLSLTVYDEGEEM